MPTFMMLGRYTDKGLSGIHESPERIKKFKDLCETEGAKLISYYMLMGKYDVVSMVEAPNAEVMAKIALVLGKKGNVRTQTYCAFTEKEQINLTGKLHH